MPTVHVPFIDQQLPNGLRLIVAEDHLAPVRLSPTRLQQVLLNLVMNAADAIGANPQTAGGRIVVRARLDTGAEHASSLEIELSA